MATPSDLFRRFLLALPLWLAALPGLSVAQDKAPRGEQPPDKPVPSCSLVESEAPRGGQLEVRGEHLGKTPVVRIGKAVTRILLRERDLIAVQIPRDSDGGPVTVQVEGKPVSCGELTIIGKNR